jgi:hypothetical protein
MKTGRPLPARVRNEEGDSWLDDAFLWGWINGNWAARGAYWNFCQVYREPAWYTERPDPGPGYRLLGKFPDEPVRGGDFVYRSDGVWLELVNECNPMQGPRIWYRRRIEPVEPVESKPVLIRRRVVEIGDEIKLPNGRVLVFNGEGFEVAQ